MENNNSSLVLYSQYKLLSILEDFEQFQMLSFTEQNEINNVCIETYGYDVFDFVDIVKETIANINESSHNNPINDRITSCQKTYEANHNDLVVISGGLDDSSKIYTESKLYEVYNSYLNLPNDKKEESKKVSYNLWGYNVDEMYQLVKNRIINEDNILTRTNKNMRLYLFTETDKLLHNYTRYILEEAKHVDDLRRHIRMVECLTFKGNRMEHAVLESTSVDIMDMSNSMVDYAEDIPTIVPWFTPDEMKSEFDIDVEPYEYILQGNKSAKLHENILKHMFQYQLDESDENVAKSVIRLGWNPNVPYNEASIKYAKDRQLEWLNNNKRCNVINISNTTINETENNFDNINLEAVYITLLSHEGINSKVIRGWTKSNYSHAGLSLDPSMKKIYSFNAATPDGSSGLSIESIDFYKKAKGAKFKVLAFFVEPPVKNKLEQVLNFYMTNKEKTHYSFASIFNLVLNKTKDTSLSLNLICSQFVDVILKAVNLDISGKPSNLVTPGDFDRISNNNSRIFDLFHDFISKYNPSNIKRKVKALLNKKLNYSNFIMTPLGEASPEVNRILDEINNILIPRAIIVEAKPLPIRFSKTGNLYIDMPRDLEIEYQEAHKLLTAYTEDNLEGIKHQLAKLFYINSIIERKIKKMNEDNDEYKKLIDLRARVLNDFKKYITIVQKYDKNFDFEQYMRNSEYYNKTIVVDKHTMKYTGNTIKEIIKLMYK